MVRISKGRFGPGRAAEVEARLRESEASLRPAILKLKGMRGYWVGLDRQQGYMTNTSLWDTLADAQQMSALREMLALRDVFEQSGVQFEPITNHEVLWALP